MWGVRSLPKAAAWAVLALLGRSSSEARTLVPRPRRRRAGPSSAALLAAIAALSGCDCDDTTRGLTGKLTIDPVSVDFGPVVVGGSEERALTLRNPGSQPIEVRAIERSPGTSADFRFAPEALTVEPVKEAQVVVGFSPSQTGPQSGSIVLRTDGEPREIEVHLEGLGVSSWLWLSPCPLDFGPVPAATTVERSVGMLNRGDHTVRIRALSIEGSGEFTVIQAGELPPLEAGRESAIRVAYAPTDGGPDQSALVVETDDPVTPRLLCVLRGEGPDLDIEAAPRWIDFGLVHTGTRLVRQVVVSNLGLADPATALGDLVVWPPEVRQGGGVFQAAWAGGGDTRLLKSGRSALVSVTFSGDGGTHEGQMVLASNDPDEPEVTVGLRGAAREFTDCTYLVTPAGLDFGTVPRGREKRLEFTFKNQGASQCWVHHVQMGPSATAVFDLPAGAIHGRLVRPAEEVRVPVRFAPTGSALTHAGEVEIHVADGDRPLARVLLRGALAPSCFTILPESLAFGELWPNCQSVEQTVTLINSCSAALDVLRVEVEAGESTDFQVTAPAIPVRLAPGSSTAFTVRYAPSDEGDDAALVRVETSEDGGAVYVVRASGRGARSTGQPSSGRLKWHWSASARSPSYTDVISPPVVMRMADTDRNGSTDAKDVPVVVFTSFLKDAHGVNGVIRGLRGDTGEELWAIEGQHILPAAALAAGDIDGDGLPEIVALRERSLRQVVAFNHDGSLLWEASVVQDMGTGGAQLADLNGDGAPEVVVGKQVFAGRTGALLWTGSGSGAGFNGTHDTGPLPAVANLDMSPDGSMEVITGSHAYSWGGAVLYSNNQPDGWVALGNFDADSFPEVVVVARGYVRLQEHDYTLKWGPVFVTQTVGDEVGGGPPTVADFDGDGKPEIGVAGKNAYVVLDGDGSTVWSAPTRDETSASTGSTVFDFDLDGVAEVLYADEYYFRVYGRGGSELWKVPNSSCTAVEYPVVADIDGDGRAEVLVVANRSCAQVSGPDTGIRAFEHPEDRWAPTRPVWNQHTYHIDNVTDDGRIPAREAPSWLSHNTYRLNRLTAACQ